MPTDADVLQAVIAAFDEIPALRASRLFIDVRKRVVTIRGQVPSDGERKTAEVTARRIVGLRALILELRVASASKVLSLAN